MRRLSAPILLPAALVASALLWLPTASVPRSTGADDAKAASATATVNALRFVPNLGQWNDAVRFAALGDTAGWLHDDGFTLRFERWASPADPDAAREPRVRGQSGCVVRTHIVDAARPTFVAGRELPGRHNFFLGNDPSRWRSDVPGHESVAMRGVLPGIDLVFRPLPEGRRGPFEYDLVLAPGADLSRFVAICDGIDALRVDGEGRLCADISTPTGDTVLVQDAPIAWQDTPSGRTPLRVAFRLLGTRSYGFVAEGLDPSCPATVDPGVLWGTYLGGGATDSINDMHWKPGTGIWLAGWAGSTDFPTVVGSYDTIGANDAFVARLQEDGNSLAFSSYVGGSSGDEARGIAVGPGDTATVVGFTASNDFPITPGAVQPTYAGASLVAGIGDAFLVRLTANGTALLGATYLGGSVDDVAEDVAVDASGNAVVVGFTFSPDFPVTPGAWMTGFQSIPMVDSDGFVTRVAANAQSLVYSTFVGGIWSEQMLEIDLDPVTNDAVIAGWTLSPNYPTTLNAYRTTSSGDNEAAVTRLNATGTAPVFSTYLGGVAAESASTVRFASDGSVWVGGRSDSVNFPVTLNAPQPTNAGFFDGFVSHLSANGQTLLFSTLLGGPGVDTVRDIDVQGSGVVVVGETGPNFPVTASPIQSQFAGGNLDGFVSFLTNGGTLLSYSTYLGGSNQDALASVQLDATGIAVVAGWSFSSDFPIAPAAFQGTLHGVEDGVVVKLDMLSELGEGLSVTSGPPPAPVVVPAGLHQVLAASLENLTGREITIDSVRLLVAGSGSGPQHAQALQVWLDVPGIPQPMLVGGPVAGGAADDEIELTLVGATLPAHVTGTLRVECNLQADAQGRTLELACAVVDRAAWQIHASGAGGGPDVRVLGTGRAEGPLLVNGALPGDADGDGAATIYDLRLLLARLGTQSPAIDCDGDLMVTAADMALMREAVLGRPALVAAPTSVAAGQWFTLRGVFAGGLLEGTLGGRALTVGRVTTRAVTLRCDATQPHGVQDLSVMLDGRSVLLGPVTVQ